MFPHCEYDVRTASKILDLPNKFAKKDIKKQYKKLSLKYHPDRYNEAKGIELNGSAMKCINSAYQTLNKHYDNCENINKYECSGGSSGEQKTDSKYNRCDTFGSRSKSYESRYARETYKAKPLYKDFIGEWHFKRYSSYLEVSSLVLRQMDKSWIRFGYIDNVKNADKKIHQNNIRIVLPLLDSRDLYINLSNKLKGIDISVIAVKTKNSDTDIDTKADSSGLSTPKGLELVMKDDPTIFDDVFDVICLEYDFTLKVQEKTRIYIEIQKLTRTDFL